MSNAGSLSGFGPIDELESVVPIQQFLVKEDGLVIAIPDVRVYSDGCQITVRLVIDRSGRDEEEWAQIKESSRSIGKGAASSPVFYVVQSDGATASTFEVPPLQSEQEPTSPVLIYQQGSGSVDPSRKRWLTIATLWLWPLPPPGDLRVGVTWGDEIGSASEISIDADLLQKASQRVKPLF